MQFENTGMGSDGDDDALTELKPRVNIMLSLERQRGTRALLVGSSSSLSSSDTRKSRFNDRPLYGSPILAASDCFTTRSSEYNDSKDTSTKSDIDTIASVSDGSLFDNSNKSDNSKQNDTKNPQHRRESMKEFFDRRLNRIRSSFYQVNPSNNVPLFVSTGKQILAFIVGFKKIPLACFYLATKRCICFFRLRTKK